MVLKTKIKCPICDGKAILSKSSLKLFNGAITISDNKMYKCEECGEKVATGKMIDKSMKKAGENFNFSKQIISTGRSLAITLPTDLLEFYKLRKGSKIRLVPSGKNEIRIITD